jgi:hypothetical protein
LIGIGLYEIYLNIMNFFPLDYDYLGSSVGHIGGMVGGVIFLTYIKLKKEV